MDFLSLLVVYCILFVVGCLCILYRDAKVLNTGLIGGLRSHISQVRISAYRFPIYATLYKTLFLGKYLCTWLFEAKVKRDLIHVQIMKLLCWLNIGFKLKILKTTLDWPV